MHINSALNTYFCGVKVRTFLWLDYQPYSTNPVNLLPGTFAFLLLIFPGGLRNSVTGLLRFCQQRSIRKQDVQTSNHRQRHADTWPRFL